MATLPVETGHDAAPAPALWEGRREYPEQDIQPERYRVKTRTFESATESVPSIQGLILAVRAARWLPAAAAPDDAAPPPTQCELAAPGQGRWVLEPDNPLSPTEPRECATCPMNQWGSAGGGRRGKACREKRLLLVLRDGEAIPIVVVAPPTSLAAVARFVTRVAARRLHLPQVTVRMTVQPTRRGAEEWGLLHIEELGLASDAELAAVGALLAEGPVGQMFQAWTSRPVHQDAAL